jgi:hypothetical protein
MNAFLACKDEKEEEEEEEEERWLVYSESVQFSI